MRHSHGYRSRTRKVFRKHPRKKGYGGLGRLMYEYNIGDKVRIDISPEFPSTAPHRRYQGRIGTVIEKRGRAYVIAIKIGGKVKKIITTKDHIVPFQEKAVES
ncbi:MAG: 50S ribosomal protein L21e [Thermoprotei archaeon]|nr:MAG: 50S ribosomal protein L21e [Thermoprotei archaeon]